MLKDIITKQLLSYQIPHTKNLTRIIKENGTVLDASDTGTGKTYTAIAACVQLDLIPFIICPKAVISSWKKVCKIFGVTAESIVNYETIRMGKYYSKTGRRMKCPFLKIHVDKDKNTTFEWNLPPNIILIFDEAHRCSNISTLNGQLLLAAKIADGPIMMLSATIADTPEKFKLYFYVLNFLDKAQVKEHRIDFKKYMVIVSEWINRASAPMVMIYNMLYPKRATMMSISTLGSLFPDTQITAEAYTIEKKREQEIQHEYKTIALELDNLRDKTKKDKGNILVKILRAHQKIEILKIPIFVELTHDFIHNGYSVAIFVNFTQTLETLAQLLKARSLIYGEQTAQNRENSIMDFQANKTKIIICNIKAGGVGISLHDIHGGHPRVSLISPTWSSIDLLQALGRVHRAGGKTKSLQRIMYTAGTVEESIADKLKGKMRDINSINNGDLDLTNIKFKDSEKSL